MLYPHAVKTALRCLMHPASLGAVLLLLLNDHVLKSAVPSVLTGKLSDFAGLFFFPFLLALPIAILAALFRRVHVRAVGCIAFVLTALWFAFAKATVTGNHIMVEIVSAIMGGETVIVRDPGDLIALLSLLPAWYFWQSREQWVERPLELRFAFPVLLLASCAVMATSPSRAKWEPGVAELIKANGKIYAIIGLRSEAYTTPDNGYTWVAARLSDIPVEPGHSLRKRQERAYTRFHNAKWGLDMYTKMHLGSIQEGERLKELGQMSPEDRRIIQERADSLALFERIRDSAVNEMNAANAAVKNIGAEPVLYGEDSVIITCNPVVAGQLYRSTLGSLRIERSDNGGTTWYVEWEIPSGRDGYIGRQMKGERVNRQIGVRDMEFLPGDSAVLIAALGSGGVLVRDREGDWSQRPIGKLDLVTPSARSFEEIIPMLELEWFALLALGLIAGVVLNSVAWSMVPRSDNKVIRQKRPRTILRFVLLGVIMAFSAILGLATKPIIGLAIPVVLFLPAALIFLALILSDWSGIRQADMPHAPDIVRISRYATLAAFILPMLCMIFWTLGIIISYQAAAITGGLLWLGSIIGGIVMMRKTKKMFSAHQPQSLRGSPEVLPP